MWMLVLQLRKSALVTAMAVLLVLAQSPVGFASDPCDENGQFVSAQQAALDETTLQPCDALDCSTGDCWGVHATTGCCHSGGITLPDRLASAARLPSRMTWSPFSDSNVAGSWSEVGRRPPRL